jgi:hypothetical protein
VSYAAGLHGYLTDLIRGRPAHVVEGAAATVAVSHEESPARSSLVQSTPETVRRQEREPCFPSTPTDSRSCMDAFPPYGCAIMPSIAAFNSSYFIPPG